MVSLVMSHMFFDCSFCTPPHLSSHKRPGAKLDLKISEGLCLQSFGAATLYVRALLVLPTPLSPQQQHQPGLYL